MILQSLKAPLMPLSLGERYLYFTACLPLSLLLGQVDRYKREEFWICCILGAHERLPRLLAYFSIRDMSCVESYEGHWYPSFQETILLTSEDSGLFFFLLRFGGCHWK